MRDEKRRRLLRGRTFAASAALTLATASVAVATAAPAGAAQLDNPYAGATPYVNPEWSAQAAADGGSVIADEPTFVWLDRMAAIDGVNGGMGLRDHLNEALSQGANLIQIVIYDLPNRDCAALASNGEIPSGGLETYEHSYIDPIADIMSDPTYANLRIVNLIEPDSLPNLVTNAGSEAGATEACRQAKQTGEYVDGVGYALAQLGALSNVYNYIDAGHHAWLGWDTNFSPFGDVAHQAATANGASVDDVAGFITNTANYSAVVEPYFDVTDTVNGTTVRQSSWVDWNFYVDELPFAQDLRTMLVSKGFNSGLGMLIDTGRSGWGGPDRPTGTSTSTIVDTYVDESRIDRRIHPGNWCNQTGAGIGERPTTAPASGIDAYVWAKPPGESDGSSEPIDNDEGKGFDEMCDPDYEGNARNGNNPTGALPNSPLAGHWFSAQFHQLLANAYPPLDGGGGGDTTAPSVPSNVVVTGTTVESVSLSWSASSDDTGVTGYQVFRDGVEVGTSSAASFTDSGLSADTEYSYTVRARDAAGNVSSASDPVTATTQSDGGGGGGCAASYHVDNDWGSGFTATVTVTNPGAATIDSWRVAWSWAGDQHVTNYWNAQLTDSGTVTADNLGYNGTVPPGSSTTFGFQATYTTDNITPTPTCTTGGSS